MNNSKNILEKVFPSSTNLQFIRLENLSKGYLEGGQKHIILEDANLLSPEGEFLAVLGKSGSGKTTLLNLISGIDNADGGDIFISGLRLSAMSERQRTLFRRENIGFIFQFFNLIPTLTVWENVTLPLSLNGHNGLSARKKAESLLDQVGLLDRRNAYPDRLSGGEQQRVAIARALVHDPLLVLADEPTGNLDEATGKGVLELLDRLTRGLGKNLILVTHSEESAKIADRVMVLRDGRLVEKAI